MKSGAVGLAAKQFSISMSVTSMSGAVYGSAAGGRDAINRVCTDWFVFSLFIMFCCLSAVGGFGVGSRKTEVRSCCYCSLFFQFIRRTPACRQAHGLQIRASARRPKTVAVVIVLCSLPVGRQVYFLLFDGGLKPPFGFYVLCARRYRTAVRCAARTCSLVLTRNPRERGL